MAIVYYPKNTIMYKRDTVSASYEQLVLNLTPNVILYFDTASNATGLNYGIADSISASYAATSSAVAGTGPISSEAFVLAPTYFHTQTGSIYTLLNSDNGKLVIISGSTTASIAVSSSLPYGFSVTVLQSGSKVATFISESGINIYNRSGFTGTSGQYAIVSLIRVGNGNFYLGGDGA